MNGPIDGMVWFQLAGILLPTTSVFALFVRIGSLLTTVRKLESDMASMTSAIHALSSSAAELAAWRDASKEGNVDMLARVRRLEDRELANNREAIR